MVEDVDSICYRKLGERSSSAIVGFQGFFIQLCISRSSLSNNFYSPSNTTVYHTRHSHDVWCLSPNVTASRALAIIAVLRAMSLFEGIIIKQSNSSKP